MRRVFGRFRSKVVPINYTIGGRQGSGEAGADLPDLVRAGDWPWRIVVTAPGGPEFPGR